MFELKNKTILIISQQSWGTMFISKHHYAIELAKLHNKVYFLNPPEVDRKKQNERISINQSNIHENLFFIKHYLNFPYNIKFHLISLFHRLMKFHIKKIEKKIPPLDIIWSFDLGHLYPFHLFNSKTYKIFHPVDEPLNQTAIDSAKGAQIILSVTKEILEKYQHYNVPKHFINHGVASHFLLPVDLNRQHGKPIRIGFSGNLLRPDIDRLILLQIIENNPYLIFDFWGCYEPKQSNIGGLLDRETQRFVEELKTKKHVRLHGAIPSNQLAKAIHAADAFLICYDVQKDHSKGTNYHKIMEYLSTGKVIVSNNVTTYKDQPGLVQMVEERDNNRSLPKLFNTVIMNLTFHNKPTLQEKRIAFALNNSYRQKLERIQEVLNETP